MKHLTLPEVKQLFPEALERHYNSGQIVAYQGDRPDNIFYVQQGTLKYYDIDEDGNEKILLIVGKGSFFPMFYSFGSLSEVGAFYTTLEEVTLLMIPLDALRLRLSEQPELALKILSWFVSETEDIVMHIKALGKTDARKKVVQALEYLARRHSQPVPGGWVQITFPLSQQTIGDFVGLSRETVSTIMKELQDDNVVQYASQLLLKIHRQSLQKLSW